MSSGKILTEPVIKMNITEEQAGLLGGTLITIGVTILATTGPMIVYTLVTTTPNNMKTCEKLIVYNVLFPDFILGILLSQILGPEIIKGAWSYTINTTHWLAFLHTACMFHAHLAAGFICFIIALSLRDAYRFEGASDMKHMSALVLCTICLTACFCSLPATEKEGYIYMQGWLGPWFNTHYQFGSNFMVLALIGIILPLDIVSVLQLFEAKHIIKNQGSTVTRRALEDLDKVIVFSAITSASCCLIIPVSILQNDMHLVMVARIAIYTCPVGRVLSLLYLCPHFQFGRSVIEDNFMDDFAKLGDEANDVTSEKLESIIAGEEIEIKM